VSNPDDSKEDQG